MVSAIRKEPQLLAPALLATASFDYWITGLIGAVVCSVFGYDIGKQKDRAVLGGVLGFLCTVVGLIMIALWPKKKATQPPNA